MRYHPVPPGLFIDNRKRLINKLPANSLVILHSNDQYPRNGDQFFSFRQQSDFFYTTGIDQEKSILILAPDCKNKKLKEALFLIETSEKIAIWEGHKYTKEEARKISGIENVYWLEEFETALKEVLADADTVFLNSNEYIKFFSEVPDRNLRFARKFKEEYPLHKTERLAPILAKLRMIKSEEEIELLKTACEITRKGFERVLRFVKPGKYEFEIQAEIDHEFTVNRANGHGYAPIVASGGSACVLHYVENNKICSDGELLLMDFGAEYANYSTDMSRTIPVNGKFTGRQKACYNAVLRVFKEAKKLYYPGNTINKLNEQVNKMMEKELIGLGLFTEEEVKKQDAEKPIFKKYFMHGTAHFLGLDVHDVGSKDEPFKPGMVLTCEPGIYIREENIGIRIENDILVTENGPVDLMENIPVEADDIERIMNK
ncbi:MAG: aminopeptidase P family protein [Chlorobi bacterium]|nr:aminopeptidase P family protein [Chlorobiota bacterium]